MKKIKEIKREIKLIQHETNQGYGASILTGFEYVTGDIIITMDSDGQHNPEEISDLIEPIINRRADIVIGSRYLGKSNYKIPLHTRVGEFFINKCLWLLFNQKVANNQSGFRVFTKESLKLFNNMRYTKFGLCTETIFKAACNKLRIIESPIIVNPRKHGSTYVKLIKLIKSIVSCISIYSLEKFGLKKLTLGSFFNSKNLSLQNNKVQTIISNESISMKLENVKYFALVIFLLVCSFSIVGRYTSEKQLNQGLKSQRPLSEYYLKKYISEQKKENSRKSTDLDYNGPPNWPNPRPRPVRPHR